jgi:hypothetical protein
MRSVLIALAFVGACLGVVAWLTMGLGIGEPLVPDPESVVQSFVDRLSAHRFEPAQSELSEDIKAQWQVENLKQLDDALREKFGEYEFELGGQEEQQGDQATYQAQIKTERQGLQQISFELEQDPETRLWKIESLEDLRSSAQE